MPSRNAYWLIGLSIFRQDCGSSCTTNHRAANGYYYACTSGGTTSACTASTGTTVSLSNQLQNPVPLFTSDNNGVLIDLPAVAPGGVPTVSGLLIFGIATQSNNTPAAGLTTLTTNASGNFSTLLTSTTPSSSYGTSFIDTGSNGIYFSTGALPVCTGPGMSGFYCPVGTANLSATLTGANAVTANILFSIDNASTLFAAGSNAVLPTLGGGTGSASLFDWGLPFYYGRRVFMGIESVAGSGAYYAF